jgi:hypothetical protein
MALSGAAVAPNQGAQSSPALAFLLTLFNVRLGAWLGNLGPAGGGRRPTWHLNDPKVGTLAIFNELFGRTTDTNPYVYLSDGGHFDNLGLYEMVLRRCHYIVVSDAGCDGNYTFEDLGNALRKIRIDLGIPITFDNKIQMTKDGAGTDRNRHAAVATIDYKAADGAEATQGVLVYIKATLTGDEPIDVVNYARACVDFPHESTVNQWFGEAEFESYRALGLHSIETIAKTLKVPASRSRSGVYAWARRRTDSRRRRRRPCRCDIIASAERDPDRALRPLCLIWGSTWLAIKVGYGGLGPSASPRCDS